MFSCGPLRMDKKRQDNQLEPTYSSSMPIRDVALKTYWKQWTIERNGERRSGISALMARHHDDDEFFKCSAAVSQEEWKLWISRYCNPLNLTFHWILLVKEWLNKYIWTAIIYDNFVGVLWHGLYNLDIRKPGCIKGVSHVAVDSCWIDFNQLNPVDGTHFNRPWYQRYGSGRVCLVTGYTSNLRGAVPPGFNPPRRS